jgi:hypothetical protein
MFDTLVAILPNHILSRRSPAGWESWNDVVFDYTAGIRYSPCCPAELPTLDRPRRARESR